MKFKLRWDLNKTYVGFKNRTEKINFQWENYLFKLNPSSTFSFPIEKYLYELNFLRKKLTPMENIILVNFLEFPAGFLKYPVGIFSPM